MKKMADLICRYFDEHGVQYQRVSDDRVRAGFQLTHSTYMVHLHADEQNGRVVLAATIASPVPAGRRAAMAEYFARGNFQLAVGSLNLDMSDGQVVFRIRVIVADGELTDGMIHDALELALTTIDTYYPSMMEIIHAVASPADAMPEAKGSPLVL